jgi:predicted Zn finger-like uncharacterized protein
MAINIICPGCHTRFKVSDKFAGKEGPCPKCKQTIKIPEKSEELIIHAPEEYGGVKDSTGKSVLKPIARRDKLLPTPVIVVIVVGCLMAVAVAWLFGRAFRDEGIPLAVLAVGALLLAPGPVLAGYAFLRDPELQPHRGTTLWIRIGICSVVYAALWGVFAIVVAVLLPYDQPQVWHLVFLVPPMFLVGGMAAHVSFDVDYTSGLFHYGLYLLVTVTFRLVMGLTAF